MNSSKGFSITSLVCGILSAVGIFFPLHYVVPGLLLLIAIAAIVFGALGIKRANQSGEPKGMAVAGLVCGIVSASLSLVFAVILLSCASCFVMLPSIVQ